MKFVSLTIIAPPEYEDKLKTLTKEAGACGATIVQGRGYGHTEKKSFFSLTFEGNHAIITQIVEEKISKAILKSIKRGIQDGELDAIAFTTPINHIVGLNTCTLKKFEDSIKQEGTI
jgi:nitrogen regulatory protein PII